MSNPQSDAKQNALVKVSEMLTQYSKAALRNHTHLTTAEQGLQSRTAKLAALAKKGDSAGFEKLRKEVLGALKEVDVACDASIKANGSVAAVATKLKQLTSR